MAVDLVRSPHGRRRRRSVQDNLEPSQHSEPTFSAEPLAKAAPTSFPYKAAPGTSRKVQALWPCSCGRLKGLRPITLRYMLHTPQYLPACGNPIQDLSSPAHHTNRPILPARSRDSVGPRVLGMRFRSRASGRMPGMPRQRQNKIGSRVSAQSRHF
ncbi:hypothetical protein MPH_02031 [Macrophomina phaseolina MS6]|uniref:Uncharacterized protein n=1 Tax=Macrophomina phaseolina (strain MS6) TaxID=1126212 RepID=K2RDS0_MACPH|nr:hypothetical protein MPH_02031 [Macrophomina phaseolina MS6]